MRVVQNPDREYVAEIKHKLKENNGYCLCALYKNKDTKCKCKDFREQIARGEAGSCNCGLWIALNDDEE